MLRAFALKAKTFKIAAKQCFGCVNEKSSQKDHMEAGCLSPIEDLMVYYEDALREIIFPDILKRLCLEMVWPCPKLSHVASSHMIQDIICNRRYRRTSKLDASRNRAINVPISSFLTTKLACFR